MTSLLDRISNVIEVVTEETAVKRKEVKGILDNAKTINEMGIFLSRTTLLEKGGISADSSNAGGNTHR